MKGTGFSPYVNTLDESPLGTEGSGIMRKPGPQRLKPGYFLSMYVRAEARTLQEQSFSATCEARSMPPFAKKRGMGHTEVVFRSSRDKVA